MYRRISASIDPDQLLVQVARARLCMKRSNACHLSPSECSSVSGPKRTALGCPSPEQIYEFLHEAPSIRNPIVHLPDCETAFDRIQQAVANGERVTIFGDYDCDGVTSVALMYEWLLELGIKHSRLSWYIPHRQEEGYGVTDSAAKSCIQKTRPSLMILVDCGSLATSPVRAWKAAGIDTIIIDHHSLPNDYRGIDAVAHLNPHAWRDLPAEAADLRLMCAAGLVFELCRKGSQKLKVYSWNEERATILAGVATVADVVPLLGINRALVKAALSLLKKPERLRLLVPGLFELNEIFRDGDEKFPITEKTFGYQWGPCINAPGRLSHATPGIKLLLSRGKESSAAAEECFSLNEKRKKTQVAVFRKADRQARAQLSETPLPKVLLMHDPKWHLGVVGIVASDIKELYARPAVVCGTDQKKNVVKGSGRSVDGFDLGMAILKARSGNPSLLEAGGGHPMAGGITIQEKNLEPFAKFLEKEVTLEDFFKCYDTLADIDAFSAKEWFHILRKLSPFGSANPDPVIIEERAILAGDLVKKRCLNTDPDPTITPDDISGPEELLALISFGETPISLAFKKRLEKYIPSSTATEKDLGVLREALARLANITMEQDQLDSADILDRLPEGSDGRTRIAILKLKRRHEENAKMVSKRATGDRNAESRKKAELKSRREQLQRNRLVLSAAFPKYVLPPMKVWAVETSFYGAASKKKTPYRVIWASPEDADSLWKKGYEYTLKLRVREYKMAIYKNYRFEVVSCTQNSTVEEPPPAVKSAPKLVPGASDGGPF